MSFNTGAETNRIFYQHSLSDSGRPGSYLVDTSFLAGLSVCEVLPSARGLSFGAGHGNLSPSYGPDQWLGLYAHSPREAREPHDVEDRGGGHRAGSVGSLGNGFTYRLGPGGRAGHDGNVLYCRDSPRFGDQSVSLRWDSAAARDIMAFGAGMLASSATYFLAGEAERLVVAKFIDLTLLGCFSLALSITAAATGAFARLANGVFYPMMASAVRDGSDPARRYRKVRLLLLTASVCAGVTFVGGGKWIVACPAGSKVCGYRLDFADLGSSCGYRVVYACHNATVVRLWNFQICGVWQHSEAGISRRRFDGGI